MIEVIFDIKNNLIFSGYCCVHKERVRQEIQPNLALHRWQELRQLRDPRNQALYLLLFGTSGDPSFQERLNLLTIWATFE